MAKKIPVNNYRDSIKKNVSAAVLQPDFFTFPLLPQSVEEAL